MTVEEPRRRGGAAAGGGRALRALRRRLGKVQLPVALGMTLVWMLLFNGFRWREESLGLAVLGFGVSVLVTVVFPLPPIGPGLRLRPLGALRLLVFVVSEMVVASLQVTRYVFAPGPPVRSSVIAVRLRTDSDLMLVFTSIILTVIPGSVVVEVEQPNRMLYVHVLGAVDDEGTERARRGTLRLEERIVRAFGTGRDITDLEAATAAGREDA
ncbi:Na+/H+ antiporter subunit E [Nocardiopsis sp. EMB25]|uniref:Na+/H+ antiporter subunit E n=1 Tax=Nocardiopsis sp. EMB25 TaxID=2835867 RepID=UPI002283B014|nr:Na+/H+ antiporter subunit E [Nocardiopsis sp. EMB25]MCY9787267.1 Na+/H+ antiporter subunit E [Nocardiopsis sp. EMB25]